MHKFIPKAIYDLHTIAFRYSRKMSEKLRFDLNLGSLNIKSCLMEL